MQAAGYTEPGSGYLGWQAAVLRPCWLRDRTCCTRLHQVGWLETARRSQTGVWFSAGRLAGLHSGRTFQTALALVVGLG